MVIRTLAGVACLGIAVLMFANGKGLLSAWPYVIMVFYASAALWFLSSFSHKIPLKQFASEMAVLAVLSLGLRVAAPQMFSVESPTQGVPKVVQPHLPATPLGDFTKRVLSYIEGGLGIMASRDTVPESQWQTWTKNASFADVKAQYKALSTDERARVWDVWKRVSEVGPMFEDMLARYVAPGPDGVNFSAPDAERATVKYELDAVLITAGQLRSRLLVYPEYDGEN